jgi:tetratricopeptide (TPR) repeat protein
LKGANQEIQRALSLIPNYPDAHGFYGVYLVVTGDLDKALIERKKMQELDPVTAFTTVNVGWSYFYKHDYDNAIAEFKKALELDPNFVVAHEALGNIYLHKKMYAEAVESFLKAKATNCVPAETIATFKQAYEAGGIKGYWQKELQETQERVKQGRSLPRRLAHIYAELGDKDQAFMWLEKAFEERNSLMIFLKTYPTFDSLRDDPRYQNLMRRVGLVS